MNLLVAAIRKKPLLVGLGHMLKCGIAHKMKLSTCMGVAANKKAKWQGARINNSHKLSHSCTNTHIYTTAMYLHAVWRKWSTIVIRNHAHTNKQTQIFCCPVQQKMVGQWEEERTVSEGGSGWKEQRWRMDGRTDVLLLWWTGECWWGNVGLDEQKPICMAFNHWPHVAVIMWPVVQGILMCSTRIGHTWGHFDAVTLSLYLGMGAFV